MLPMSRGGRRRAEAVKSSRGPLYALGAMFLGTALGAFAWFVLVRAAIDFGGSAKNGRGIAWVFMVMATLGAIACLVLALILASRALTALGIIGRNHTPHSHAGGHRH